jgi:hypothetical protein
MRYLYSYVEYKSRGLVVNPLFQSSLVQCVLEISKWEARDETERLDVFT